MLATLLQKVKARSRSNLTSLEKSLEDDRGIFTTRRSKIAQKYPIRLLHDEDWQLVFRLLHQYDQHMFAKLTLAELYGQTILPVEHHQSRLPEPQELSRFQISGQNFDIIDYSDILWLKVTPRNIVHLSMYIRKHIPRGLVIRKHAVYLYGYQVS